MRVILPALGLMIVFSEPASAQVIQQPIIGVKSVQTTVSVPDRGSALLGGVSRAYGSFNHYGFSPFGSSQGLGASNGSTRVFVTIHDFEEADRQLLSVETPSAAHKFRNRRAAGAWSQLKNSR